MARGNSLALANVVCCACSWWTTLQPGEWLRVVQWVGALRLICTAAQHKCAIVESPTGKCQLLHSTSMHPSILLSSSVLAFCNVQPLDGLQRCDLPLPDAPSVFPAHSCVTYYGHHIRVTMSTLHLQPTLYPVMPQQLCVRQSISSTSRFVLFWPPRT